MGVAYGQQIYGNRKDNTAKAINYFRQAIAADNWDSDPVEYAKVLSNLAQALINNHWGDQEAQIEEARQRCLTALKFVNQTEQPTEWARVVNMLGKAYLKRTKDGRDNNLKQAIEYLQQSLAHYTPTDFPLEHARTQIHLVVAHLNRRDLEKERRLALADAFCEQAVALLNPDDNITEWAEVQHLRARIDQERFAEKDVQELHAVIQRCQQAIDKLDGTLSPALAAGLHKSMADAYSQLGRENRAENVEQAIYHYEQALEIRSREVEPQGWAATITNLATTYKSRFRGKPAENYETAIGFYLEALEVRTATEYPFERVLILQNLADSYLEHPAEATKQNIELAIYYCYEAAKLCPFESRPVEWAYTQKYLGQAYWRRIDGERAANIEQAINYYEQALTVFTEEAFPSEYASLNSNLGIAFATRLRGDRAINYERSIWHYQQALQVYSAEKFPRSYANTLLNLCVSFTERILGDRLDNLKNAITCGEEALQFCSLETNPSLWAGLNRNLALAYNGIFQFSATRETREQIYRRSKECSLEALKVRTRESFRTAFAQIQCNLGNAHLAWAEYVTLKDKKFDQYLERAIQCYETAVDAWTPTDPPDILGKFHHNLGQSYSLESRVQDLEKAKNHYLKTLDIYWVETWPIQNRDANAALGVLCFREEQYAEARSYFEAAHQAILVARGENTLELSRRLLGNENANIYAQLVTCCLEMEDIASAFTFAAAAKGRAFIDELTSQYLKAGLSGQEWEEQWRQRANNVAATLTLEEAQNLAHETDATLVEYYQHAHGWVAFVVTDQEVHPIALPAVSERLFYEGTNWTKAVADFFRGLKSYRFLERLHAAFIAPILDELTSTTRPLLIAPFRKMHWLPLRLARSTNGSYLFETHNVNITYSLSAFKAIQEQIKQNGLQHKINKELLTVAYPGTEPYLTEVLPEAEMVEAHFRHNMCTRLWNEQATTENFLKNAPRHRLIHIGCHGLFNLYQPGLRFADRWLTIPDILTSDLRGCELVTLAACQTGEVGVDWGDSYLGLTTAFLIAGSENVVSSLWSVDDAATRKLFETFYYHLARKVPAAEALTKAQLAVRNSKDESGRKRWSHPYYWAAFQLYGNTLNNQVYPPK